MFFDCHADFLFFFLILLSGKTKSFFFFFFYCCFQFVLLFIYFLPFRKCYFWLLISVERKRRISFVFMEKNLNFLLAFVCCRKVSWVKNASFLIIWEFLSNQTIVCFHFHCLARDKRMTINVSKVFNCYPTNGHYSLRGRKKMVTSVTLEVF